jgi:hypothetical protein
MVSVIDFLAQIEDERDRALYGACLYGMDGVSVIIISHVEGLNNT